VCCVVMVAGAGACQRGRTDPIPSPTELGAGPFPEGSTQRDLDVVYTGRTRPDCTELIALTPDGSAHHTSVCGGDPAPLVDDPDRWTGDSAGDYAYRDGRLWVRTVVWDAVSEEFVLSEWDFGYCANGLFDVPPDGSQRFPFEFAVAAGAGPPTATSCG
jgi:hypothetical protein